MQVWPLYPLGDKERWPGGESINFNAILQLNMFYKKEGKWTEVPHNQLFIFLRDASKWMNESRLHTQIMVALCKKPPTPLRNQNQEKPSDAPSAPLLLPYPGTSYTIHHPTRLYLH
jgi:hypothetical protein